MDGIASEFLEKGGDCVTVWLVSIFIVHRDHSEVPHDWQYAYLTPLYKSKGLKGVCSN